MKKKNLELDAHHDVHHQLEIVKAVAQAWYAHSGSSRTTNEFDAHRRNFKSQPSRFKLEAMNYKLPAEAAKDSAAAAVNWDFRQSLWDSYEIVTVTKKLESGLTMDNLFSGLEDKSRVRRRRRESKNSLRNLFNRLSSRRFNDSDLPDEKDDDDEVNQF